MFAGKASFLFAIQGLKCQLFSFKINSETNVKMNFYQRFSENNMDPSEKNKKNYTNSHIHSMRRNTFKTQKP